MTTRGTMKTEIADDMERDVTADGSRILAAISAAIKFYQPKRFFFNESRSVTFSTVAGTDTYDFGSGEEITTEFYRIDACVLTDGSNNHFLHPRDYRELETLIEASSTQNRPRNYAYISRALRLYPVPDAVYTVRLTGHARVAEPAADDTANNAWFVEAYELIRCRAKAYLYAHVFPDANMAVIMKQAEAEALSALQSATYDRVGTGQIVPTDF